MELVLIRHTAVEVAPGVCYGRLDLPLAPSAEADIAAVLARLRPVGLVVCSPAARCRRLGEAIARRDVCRLAVEPDLSELDFGAWEGRRWDTIDRAQSDPWAEDPWNRAPPGGEREADLWSRVQRWWLQWSTAQPDYRVAIVAHGGPLRLLRCWLSGRSFEQRWDFTMPPGGLVELSAPFPAPCSREA